MFHYLRNKNQTSLCKHKNLKSTISNKEIEAKTYSKNEDILDFEKKKYKMTRMFFFFPKIEPGDFFFFFFFQKVETDQHASRLSIQPTYTTFILNTI